MNHSRAASAILATGGCWPLAAAAQGASQPIGYDVLLRLSGALTLVVVLVFAAAWAVRRMGRLPAQGSGAMRLLGGLVVGQRERIVLVQVGRQRLLLGVAPGRVQMLQALGEEPLAGAPGEPAAAGDRVLGSAAATDAAPPATQFAARLGALLRRGAQS